jgi:hypothetical protein
MAMAASDKSPLAPAIDLIACSLLEGMDCGLIRCQLDSSAKISTVCGLWLVFPTPEFLAAESISAEMMFVNR